MGLIAKVLSVTRSIRNGAKFTDVKTDSGGGANVTVEHFSDIGDDSLPLDTDYCVEVDIPRTGGRVIVGYVDPDNEQKAQKGEKRLYARNTSGDKVCELWLKADGSVVIENSAGSFELESGGDVVINGVVISTTGEITCDEITVNGIAFTTHIHGGVTTGSGSTSGPGGPP